MAAGLAPLEKLRRIWTPTQDVEEVIRDLDPRSELDSLMREIVSRMVHKYGSITLDITDPVPDFTVRWEVVNGGTGEPGSRRQLSIWKEERNG